MNGSYKEQMTGKKESVIAIAVYILLTIEGLFFSDLVHLTIEGLVSPLGVGKIGVTEHSNAMHKRMVTIASSPLILRRVLVFLKFYHPCLIGHWRYFPCELPVGH
jgi:hypothetical protein